MKAAKMYKKYLAFIILSFCLLDGHSQSATSVNMQTTVVLNKPDDTFESMLNSVSKQTGVVFSFSSKKIPGGKMVTLKPGKQTLETFLNQVTAKTGLYYKVVGTHIIFLEKQPSTARTNVPSREVVSTTKSKVTKKPTAVRVTSAARNVGLEKDNLNASNAKQNKPPTTTTHNQSPDTLRRPAFLQRDSSQMAVTNTSAPPLTNSSDSLPGQSRDSVSVSADTTTTRTNDSSAVNLPVTRTPMETAPVDNNEDLPSKLTWFLGAQLSRIMNFESRNDRFNLTGIGAGIKVERQLAKKWALTAALGFDYFTGTYTYTKLRDSLADTTVSKFAKAPLFLGVKYYFLNKFYASVEFGPALRASHGTRTKLAIAPSAGVQLPLKNRNVLDLSLRYTYVITGFGTLELNNLQNGGYGFLSLRVAYGIPGKRLADGAYNSGNRAASEPQQAQLLSMSRVDLNLQGLGFSFEPRMSRKLTVDMTVGIGGGYAVSEDGVDYGLDITDPAGFISVNPKFFYNRQKRIEKGKVSVLNAGNYIGMRFKFVTKGLSENNEIYDALLMNLHWGIQRPLAKRWLFSGHAGVGYALDASDLSNSFGTVYPAIDLKIGYVLSRAKR